MIRFCTSGFLKGGLPFLSCSAWTLRGLSSPPSPMCRRFARLAAKDGAQAVKFTHSLLFATKFAASSRMRPYCHSVSSASLYRRPSSRCFHRPPILPDFPAFPRSPARFLSRATSPRTGAPILRTASFCFFWTPPPTKYVESLLQTMQLLPWERVTSRRFAQECPEGNPGKSKQEK
jgi:hypothetical protein